MIVKASPFLGAPVRAKWTNDFGMDRAFLNQNGQVMACLGNPARAVDLVLIDDRGLDASPKHMIAISSQVSARILLSLSFDSPAVSSLAKLARDRSVVGRF